MKVLKKEVPSNEDLKSKVYGRFMDRRKNRGTTALYRLNAIEMEQGRRVTATDDYASDVPVS